MDYETKFVTFNVRRGNKVEQFGAHRDLTCRASTTFDDVFRKEVHAGQLVPDVALEGDPDSFKPLLDWLYTGNIKDIRHYTKNQPYSDDLFWYRVCSLADEYSIPVFRDQVYQRFRSALTNVIPSVDLIEEVFTKTDSRSLFREYLVRHTAYQLARGPDHGDNWQDWDRAFGTNQQFTRQVLSQIAKIKSTTYTGSKLHPSVDLKFANTVAAPAPARIWSESSFRTSGAMPVHGRLEDQEDSNWLDDTDEEEPGSVRQRARTSAMPSADTTSATYSPGFLHLDVRTVVWRTIPVYVSSRMHVRTLKQRVLEEAAINNTRPIDHVPLDQ